MSVSEIRVSRPEHYCGKHIPFAANTCRVGKGGIVCECAPSEEQKSRRAHQNTFQHKSIQLVGTALTRLCPPYMMRAFGFSRVSTTVARMSVSEIRGCYFDAHPAFRCA